MYALVALALVVPLAPQPSKADALSGAIEGAIIGGVLGALTGGERGARSGAAIGGGLGAISGAYEQERRERLYEEYTRDLENEIILRELDDDYYESIADDFFDY